jgi:hypothetical protein
MTNSRIYLGALAGIIIVLVLIALAAGSVKSQSVKPSTDLNLMDYVQTDVEVRLTVERPVEADEDHKSTQATVSRNSRTVAVYKTYNSQLLGGQNYENNQAAFTEFMAALDRAGFTRQNPSSQESEAGYCPTGTRYVYELVQDQKVISHLWSDSCGDPQRTFMGNGVLVRQIIQSQIPNYSRVVSQAASGNQ